MAVTSYDAKDCTVTVDGVFITQLGEDMISFEKEESYFEPVVGAQGDVIKSMVNNPLYTLTLTIQPTSPQKAFLMSKLGVRENFPVWVNNKALGERFGGTLCAISEMPEIARGSEAEDLEITFTVFDGVLEVTE